MKPDLTHIRRWPLILLMLPLLSGQCSKGNKDTSNALSSSLPVISALGDSITLGVGSQTGGYPAGLQIRLDQEGYRGVVQNLGVSGEKAYQTRQRFAQVLEKSDVILLMIGFNDFTRPDECPKPLGCRSLEYIEVMAVMAGKKGIPLVLGTLTPPQPGNIRAWADPIIRQFNHDLRQLASRHGIALVDTYGIMTEHQGDGVFADHVHPNERGYTAIAEGWYEALVQKGLVSKGR